MLVVRSGGYREASGATLQATNRAPRADMSALPAVRPGPKKTLPVMTPETKRRLKFAIFASIPWGAAAATFALFFWCLQHNDPLERGLALNKKGWESSFEERGLPVPPSGPREGYWAKRLGAKVRHPSLGWHEPMACVSDLLDIDENGLQYYYTSSPGDRSRIVILGGSVAFGGYASSIYKTYFHVLGVALEESGTPSDIAIIAAGAWKSIQELAALRLHGQTPRPDLIVFLNGLNDLTSGATVDTLFDEPAETRAAFGLPDHAHDYGERVHRYLANMEQAARAASGLPSSLMIVLQPSLVERQHRTSTEEVILKAALQPHASAEALATSYERMRQGLTDLGRSGMAQFRDFARLFDSEKATTFADIWHFSDAGHELLGKKMAREIAPVLRKRQGARGRSGKDSP